MMAVERMVCWMWLLYALLPVERVAAFAPPSPAVFRRTSSRRGAGSSSRVASVVPGPAEVRETDEANELETFLDTAVEEVVVRKESETSFVPPIDLEASYVLSMEQVKPLLKFGSDDKQKIINGFGLWCLCVSLATGPVWTAAMTVVDALARVFPEWDQDKAIFDSTGKVWAKTWLTWTQSFPTVTGDLDRIRQDNGREKKACLYVANHASWLDIPVLCTVLDPVFKFIAKGELQKVPCVGQQLIGGHHILIDREDRRSQLRTFKEGLDWLVERDVPLMAFPEGQRSVDGKLLKFRGGLFKLAKRAGVDIVPISIAHAHAVMPSNSYFPVQPGAGKLHVHVHDAIETSEKSEEELEELVRTALLSMMPRDQHPDE